MPSVCKNLTCASKSGVLTIPPIQCTALLIYLQFFAQSEKAFTKQLIYHWCFSCNLLKLSDQIFSEQLRETTSAYNLKPSGLKSSILHLNFSKDLNSLLTA